MNYKISISGELGSGKSLLGKTLGEKLNCTFISIGTIQRELAKKYSMSTIEFNKYMQNHPEIDIECDDKIIEYGKKNDCLIIDSRLAWHFIPNSYKIHLLINQIEAANRILNDKYRKNEKYQDLAEARENMILRKQIETNRFLKQYNININDLSNYDLVIDTTFISPDLLGNFVFNKFIEWVNNRSITSVWLSPKNIFPTQEIREHSIKYIKEIIDIMNNNGYDILFTIKVIKWDNYFFIYDGHKRCSAAIQSNINLIPVDIINLKHNNLPFGQTYHQYLKDNCNLKNIYDWEELNNFRFIEYITL